MSDDADYSAIRLAELTIGELEKNDDQPRDALVHKGGPTQQAECARRVMELKLDLEGLYADIRALTRQGKLDEATELQKRVDAVKNRFNNLKNRQ